MIGLGPICLEPIVMRWFVRRTRLCNPNLVEKKAEKGLVSNGKDGRGFSTSPKVRDKLLDWLRSLLKAACRWLEQPTARV